MRREVADELKKFIEQTSPSCRWRVPTVVKVDRQLTVLGVLFSMLEHNAKAILRHTYDKKYERQADELVRDIAWGRFEKFDSDERVSRILVERVTQAVGTLVLNIASANPEILVPSDLSRFQRDGRNYHLAIIGNGVALASKRGTDMEDN